jgi:hypothetical protein
MFGAYVFFGFVALGVAIALYLLFIKKHDQDRG